ncbi:MFS transporter [Streptomyces spectabilis]|uniref:MFS transporter n=1 Tax=Streptomyces spectabilis TaxID=68270 RepID=A0A5P2X8W7_STRST|nr:MFS transporter [Streptomyces spectabilis]MBB5106044.1 putative MFS family arabinose efflux permease [Streptomyces spectabilis]MCI3901574.1 MFS transporter [Streptomyces spectabilis]QEV59026.1 MFS transporter [Streptomyces spectabilis]GGV25642.1 MFS transporter [Streptomyces spectabilis]
MTQQISAATGAPSADDGGRTRWAPVVVMALAMLMVTLELSLSAVTLPAMGDDLGVGSSATQWVLLAYALPTAALALPAGRWSDRVDLRAVFLLATPAIGLTSVLAALAPNLPVLVAARVLQGVAGAVVGALYMPVVAMSVPPKRRGRAMGYIATIMPLGSMGGSSLGGAVVDAYGWRPVFLLKIPVLIAVVWLGARLIPRGDKGLVPPSRSLVGDGVVLGAAVTALLVAFDRIDAGAPVAAGAAAAVAVAGGAWWARLRTARPVLDLLRRPEVGLPVLALFLSGTFTGLSYFLLPYYVADVLDAGASLTGLAMMFFIGAVALTASFGGALADRFPKALVGAAGAALTGLGVLSMLTLGPDAGLWDIGWRLAVTGAGQALFGTPVSVGILERTPPDLVGTAGGVTNTFRTLAFTVGPALAALAYGTGGAGVPGFRSGIVLLAALQFLSMVALLPLGRGSRA